MMEKKQQTDTRMLHVCKSPISTDASVSALPYMDAKSAAIQHSVQSWDLEQGHLSRLHARASGTWTCAALHGTIHPSGSL